MGAAAYNRGTAAISAQIDAERPSADLTLLRDLSAFSAERAGAVLFQPTVVRFGPALGEVALMNRQRGGWRQRSYVYNSLWALAREWRVSFVSFGRDEHGRFLNVVPLMVSDAVMKAGK